MEICRKFIITKGFEKQWQKIGLDDDELSRLQVSLLENPKIGEVIPGTGRLRKMRFNYKNRGKSHCARVCYIDFEVNGIIVLMIVFAKNDMENLDDNEKNDVKKMIKRLEETIK